MGQFDVSLPSLELYFLSNCSHELCKLTDLMGLTCSKRVQQRLALYQGVSPIYMQFLDDAEETFENALSMLQVSFHLTIPSYFLIGNSGYLDVHIIVCLV